jgi:integrase
MIIGRLGRTPGPPPWLRWIEQPPSKRPVAGSSPAGGTTPAILNSVTASAFTPRGLPNASRACNKRGEQTLYDITFVDNHAATRVAYLRMAKLALAATETTPLDRLAADYLQAVRGAGRSAKTARIYSDALYKVLLPFCRETGVTEGSQLTSRRLNELTAGLLDGTLSISGRPLAKPTVHSYVRAINTFLAWAAQEGEAVTARAQRPRLDHRVLDVLSRDEILAMEEHAGNERDKLIVRILADTGIRLAELLKLTASDLRIDGRKPYLRVQGKGGRERLVPVFPTLARRLERYVERGRRESRSGRLFLGLRRRPSSGEFEELRDSGVQQMIRALAEEAGIRKRVYPHLFRHSFITWQLRTGTNPIVLSRIVGHESLTMINQVYANLTMEDAHDALMRSLLAERSK